MKIAIASTISRPANQSVTIFDIGTLSSTAPMPDSSRPVARPAKPVARLAAKPPAAISSRPKATIRLSPKRRPSAPPGRAMNRPGRK